MKQKLVIIGCGNMGSAIVEALLQKEIYQSSEITIVERFKNDYTEKFALKGCIVINDIKELNDKPGFLILAVKPQVSKDVLQELSPLVDKDSVVLSIMAGIPLSRMEKVLANAQIIRCMPNTPCLVHLGMSVYCGNKQVKESSYQQAGRILEAMGKAIRVEEEKMIDGATAISGSGPAYIFYLAEALQEGAENLGFNQKQAATLATQTLLGAATLLDHSEDIAAELRRKVTSPGGTTEAALISFERNEIKKKLMEGFQEAFNRSIALGKD